MNVGGFSGKSMKLMREVIRKTKEIIKDNYPVTKPKVVSRRVKKEKLAPKEIDFKCENAKIKKYSEIGRYGLLVTITLKEEPNPMGKYKFCDLEEKKRCRTRNS